MKAIECKNNMLILCFIINSEYITAIVKYNDVTKPVKCIIKYVIITHYNNINYKCQVIH